MSLTTVQQRFDDRLTTILAIDASNRNGANSLWSQLVDLLAQGPERLSGNSAERALAALSMLRDRVDIEVRQHSAVAIAGRCRSAPLAVLLSGDRSAVVCSLFDHLRLGDSDWQAVMPVIGPLARSRLRQRLADLPPSAVRALDSLAAGDLGLPLPNLADDMGQATQTGAMMTVAEVEALPPQGLPAVDTDADTVVGTAVNHMSASSADWAAAPTSIAELVRRIDDWRRQRPANDSAIASLSPSEVRLSVDIDGYVRAAEGIPNASICGLSFAEPARPEQTGVDAGVARAFARRAPISGGRLYIAPGLPWSGLWSVSASPQFDNGNGRFLGYRATMEPAVLGREPSVAPEGSKPQLLAEAMRQLVHELRSPLNAISGFAQLIEGQYFGPVTSNYRTMVLGIRQDAARLLRVFDDLDMAARIDLGSASPRQSITNEVVDLVATMRALVADGHGHGTAIHSDVDPVLVTTTVEPLRALLVRLLDLTKDQQDGADHIVQVSGGEDGHMVLLEMSGLNSDNGDNGLSMPLGQDFSMRLIEQLATNAGATLDLTGDKAILNFRRANEPTDRVGVGPA